jgi:hypothetical protein
MHQLSSSHPLPQVTLACRGGARLDDAFPLLIREPLRARELLLQLGHRCDVPGTVIRVGSAEFQGSSAHLEPSASLAVHD